MATIADPEKWRELVMEERLRQLGLGYTPEHDDEHGVVHLLQLIVEYSRRAQTVEAGALADAALDVIRRGAGVTGDTSDGYHTFDELYEYRMLYHAHAAHGWLAAGIPVVKSWRHSDGEPCFGGGWFIVSTELPTGQVTNHYKAEHWGLFDVPEVELPPTYDGHTPAVAADRLWLALQEV